MGNALRGGIDAVALAIHGLLGLPPPRPAPVSAPDIPARAVLFGLPGRTPTRGPLESLEAVWREDPESWLWVHWEGSPGDMRQACARLGIEPVALRSAADADSAPVAEPIGATTRVVWREAAGDGFQDGFPTEPFRAFVADRVVATCRADRSPAVLELNDDVAAGRASPDDPMDLALRLGRRIAERLVDLLDVVESLLDDIEDRVFGEPDDAILSELTALKSTLRAAARVGRAHERTADRIAAAEDASASSPESRAAAAALREFSERLRTLADLYAQTATDLTDGYLAMSAHRLNRVMQILTVVTVVFVPMTFIAGVYGMNFVNMPELGTRYGYFVVVAVMLVAAVVQIAFFRRRKWL